MSYVLVKSGEYRNRPVKNTVFPLIKNFQFGANGGYVTVDGSSVFGADFHKVRIKTTPDQLDIVGQDVYEKQEHVKVTVAASSTHTAESDEKRIQEIEERFEILDEMTKALTKSDIRAMIVTGPPGVGKSYGVEEQLSKSSIFGDMAGNKRKYEVVKGAMTALGLYAKLYEYADKGNVVVFDDCDSVLMDDLSLNILKAALDSGKKRKIFWNADSNKLRSEGIPDSFEFKGSACFITNIKFENVKSKRLQDHLEALMSRAHYVDLTLDTMRDKLLRIKQIARKGDLFEGYNFSKSEEQEIINYMQDQPERFREMSLRMALKLADLKKISGNWKKLAETTCMKMGV